MKLATQGRVHAQHRHVSRTPAIHIRVIKFTAPLASKTSRDTRSHPQAWENHLNAEFSLPKISDLEYSLGREGYSTIFGDIAR